MRKQKMTLPLAMLLCVFMFSLFNTVSASKRWNYSNHQQASVVPYSLSYLASLKKQSVQVRGSNYSQVKLNVPSGQAGFRDWVVTLYQNGSPVYTFYTWFSPNFSWTSEWTLGEVDPGVYDVYVQCVNDPSGGYYADIFWDCPDSNDVDQYGGDQDIYSVFNDPYYFGSIDINGTLYINTSCNH